MDPAAPEEVYRLIPVTNFDGVAVSYQSRFDGFTNIVRASYGSKDARLPDGGEVESRHGMTLVDTLEWGATTLFASYNRSDLTIDSLNPLFDAFREFGPRGEAIAERYDVNDNSFEFIALGALRSGRLVPDGGMDTKRESDVHRRQPRVAGARGCTLDTSIAVGLLDSAEEFEQIVREQYPAGGSSGAGQ